MRRAILLSAVFGSFALAAAQDDDDEDEDSYEAYHHDEKPDLGSFEAPPPLPSWTFTEEQMDRIITKLDADHDQKVSMDEIVEVARRVHLRRLMKDYMPKIYKDMEFEDADGDGMVSLEEHKAVIDAHEFKVPDIVRKLEVARFGAADLNGDNKLNRQEYPPFYAPVLKSEVLKRCGKAYMVALDMDDDRRLTREEYMQGQEDNKPRLKLYESSDIDKDGLISIVELTLIISEMMMTAAEFQYQLWNRFDTDSDGHLSYVELHNAREHIGKNVAYYTLANWLDNPEIQPYPEGSKVDMSWLLPDKADMPDRKVDSGEGEYDPDLDDDNIGPNPNRAPDADEWLDDFFHQPSHTEL